MYNYYWFESSHSDNKTLGIFTISRVFCCFFIVKLLFHVECPCNSDRNNTIFCICVSAKHNIFIVYKCTETTKRQQVRQQTANIIFHTVKNRSFLRLPFFYFAMHSLYTAILFGTASSSSRKSCAIFA